MDLLKDDPQALCLVRATSGHYVIIAASCCVAYAENKRHDNRVNSVRAFLAALDLLQASGNIDARYVLEQRENCRIYRLKLGNSNDSTNGFRAARYVAFPDGFFFGERA